MNPQQKKMAMIVGGIATAVVLVIILFVVTRGGNPCNPVENVEKSKPPNVDSKNLKDLTNDKFKIKINARIEYTNPEGDKKAYYVLSDASGLEGDAAKVNVTGTCIKKISMANTAVPDGAINITEATVEIENQKDLNKGKPLTCKATLQKISIAREQYFKCEKPLTTDCKYTDVDQRDQSLKLVIPILYLGGKDVDFTKDFGKIDCQ